VKAAVELASKPVPPSQDEQDEVERLAAEALKRVQDEENAKHLRALRSKARRAPKHHSPRSFVLMWSELEGWTALYDVLELAAALKDDDWARFERVVAETIELRDQLREARTSAASA
jgi:ParB family chromosome partitioning protein